MVNQRKSVEHLFEQALALKASERSAFLDEACSSSPALREMVERLLEEDAQAGSFLNSPLFGRPKIAGPLDEVTAETWPHGPDYSPAVENVPDGCFRENDILAGRFRIVRFIAAGGMGEVYEVEDRQLQGVRLALKTILPHIAANPHMQQRFEREVLLARRVVHPNLCPIYDIFHCRHQDTDLMFLTMKLLPGETLSSRIKREGAISLDEAGRIVSQVGAALAAAHDAGILHRDIKTANIMLAGAGEQVHAWVTDFGLARAYQGETTVLTADGVAGTPGYVAPELFLGVPPSKASDVYAFGVVIYKMVTGFSPPVRLNPSTKVTRDPFTEQLPAAWKRLIEYCLEPSVEKRCQSFPEVIASLGERNRRKMVPSGIAAKLSRRRLIAMGAGTAAAVAGGVWLDWTQIDFAMHPLPPKRFVALLGWPPPSDARVAPAITAAVDAIGSELARAEAFDRNLLIIPHSVSRNIVTLAQVNDLRESLGANLVLAVSGLPGGKELELLLRVLDPAVSRTLRERPLNVAPENQLSLPRRAVRLAAELLNISQYEPDDQRMKVGTTNTDAYRAFQEGEALRAQENDTGLDAAIEKYTQAVNLDAGYAVAQAALSWAYLRSYGIHFDSAALDLASANCEAAMALDPNLVLAHLARSSVYEQKGDFEKASSELEKALSLDPSDSHTLTYQADFYAACNRWSESEETFTRVLKMRPNYWLAHQEHGVILDQQGKYREALADFRSASLLAPKNALALKNVGTVYLQLGKLQEALDHLIAAFALSQDDDTALALADLFRIQQKYSEARDYAQKAVKLNPNDASNWFELGDTQAAAGNSRAEVDAAYRKAAAVQDEKLRTSPKDGPAMMFLALCRAKTGQPSTAALLLDKAEPLFVDDMDSQLLKVRVLELVGRRDEALATVARCLSRGPTLFQFETMPDLERLRTSPEYKKIMMSASSEG